MKIRTIKYHIEEGFKGIFKNGLMSLASIATVAACAFILIVSLCIVINIDYILEQIEDNIGISVFIGDDVNDLQLENVSKSLKSIENIREVKYISKEDALKWAKEKWGDDSDILQGLESDNPFPRSFEISLKNASAQGDVVNEIEKIQHNLEIEIINKDNDIDVNNEKESLVEIENNEVNVDSEEVAKQKKAEKQTASVGTENYKYRGIEKISHAQQEAEMLIAISTALRVVSIVLIIIMCIVSVAIIMNTIKLTVFIRKNEINIMKYVGATDWFIRLPFVVEGLLIGLIGSLIPLIICVFGYNEVLNIVDTKLYIINNIASLKMVGEIFKIVFPATIGMGMILGAVGSITSMRKYLDV